MKASLESGEHRLMAPSQIQGNADQHPPPWRLLWQRGRVALLPNKSLSLPNSDESRRISQHPSLRRVDPKTDRGGQTTTPKWTETSHCQSHWLSLRGDSGVRFPEKVHNSNLWLLFRNEWPGSTHQALSGQDSDPLPQRSAFVP